MYIVVIIYKVLRLSGFHHGDSLELFAGHVHTSFKKSVPDLISSTRHLKWVEKPILKTGLLCDWNGRMHEGNFVRGN